MDQKEYYYLYYKDAINIMVDYINAVKENNVEEVKKLKEDYKKFREGLFEDKKYFKGLKRRKFLKTIVKHEDLSTTPKFVKSELQKQKRYHFEVIMLFYLIALKLATKAIIDESMLVGIISFIDMKYVLKVCKEYDTINEELDDIKIFIKEYTYADNK